MRMLGTLCKLGASWCSCLKLTISTEIFSIFRAIILIKKLNFQFRHGIFQKITILEIIFEIPGTSKLSGRAFFDLWGS